ncbi:MAG: cytoplasmic iron level regulating protein YaaA (DUF328/UPF0246 family) [Bacteriovoracaceae bacterium]|jgi:cytoplasmic iron level regulating protein YaaA (DUF328/UPF0246 family)
MLIVISPAKKLDFENQAPLKDFSQPLFLKEANLLINDLKKCKPEEISKLMGLSENLTKLNIQRYKTFKTPFNLKNSKQALYAFRGDTYVGLDADTMESKQVKFAQDHLRILSGLYGLVSPLDLIQPYRLEMGTKFSCQGKANLHKFWNEPVTNKVNELLDKKKVLINLASKEYFSAIDLKKLNGEVITPVFKEKKDDDYKIISFFAKKARGMMSRYIIDNELTDPKDILSFDRDNYKYNKKLSTPSEPVFTR